MKTAFLCGLVALPLVASAQKLRATQPPVPYHVGLTKAPLFHGAADTTGRPSQYLPSQAEATVVGQFSPQWVIVKLNGFLYLTPVASLTDYDAADVTPLPIDPTTHLITYEGVVNVPGTSQADLYARALAWISKEYNQSNAQLQRQDPAAGQIVLQGARPAVVRNEYEGVLRSSYAGVVRHTLTIYVKDGRYKYILTNLSHDALGTPNMNSGGPLEQDRANLYGYAGIGSHKPWVDMKTDATRDVRHVLADLEAAMTLQAPKAKKNPSDF